MRRIVCFFLACCTLLFAGNASLLAAKPNVVLILADDLGWRDLSKEGSTFYESPHIDSIANSGMRFTQGYATCQVCSPSRASIMLGTYPARHGITDWIGAAEGAQWKRNTKLLPAKYNHVLPAKETTLAEALKSNGYRTFFAGKWHLGGEDSLPTDHGFDVNVGGHHRGSPPGGYFAPYNNPEMENGPNGESLPLRLGNDTANFIKEHVAENANEPYFAMLSFYSVHGPLQTSKKLWSKYRDKASQFDAPENRFIVDRTSPVRQVQDHPVYAGMVESMDDAVGLVLDAIRESGQQENTIVIFTSDNGGVSAGDGKATSNLPLRGGKGRQWQGGIREPLYIALPKKIEAGTTTDTPATGADLYPTILGLAGLKEMPQQHRDGVDLTPVLHGESIEDRALFWHYPHYGNQGGEPSAIIIDGDWKLIHYYEDGRDELYNIRTDIGEQNDLAKTDADRTAKLRKQLDAWFDELKPNMPIENPNFNEEAHEREKIATRERTLPKLEKDAANFLDENYKSPKGQWWGAME